MQLQIFFVNFDRSSSPTLLNKSTQDRRTRGEGGLCVEVGFTWTSQRNLDATMKLKSEIIGSFIIPLPTPS